MEDRKKEISERYLKAIGKMQAGVAARPDKSDQEPKHLRVGVNSMRSGFHALAMLLIKKGVITEMEYLEAIAEDMESEAESIRLQVAKEMGIEPERLTLGHIGGVS